MQNLLINLFSSFFKKPLKIGIISYYYPLDSATSSGVGTHVYYLVENLAKLGCEVHVFSYGLKDRVIKTKVGDGKKIIHLLNASSGFVIQDSVVSKRLRYAVFENRVLNAVTYENYSKKHFDIIHTHGWLTSAAFMLKHFHNFNWVHTFHALERKRLKSMTKDEKKFYNITSWIEDTIIDADRLIAVSDSLRSDVLKTFKKVSKKTVTISNGVDLRLFSPKSNLPLTVLYIGRFSKEKGIHLIPRLVEDVLGKSKKYKFIVVAPKNVLPELEDIQKRLNSFKEKYPNQFTLISEPLMKEDLSKIYKGSGIYIQPSNYESFGLCILEAMASGNAVVATRVGGIPEVVGNAGILTNLDSKEISKKILKLLKNRNMRKKYSKLAIERSKRFSWESVAKKILDLYKEIISEKENIKLSGKI